MIGAVRSFSRQVREALAARPERLRAGVEITLALVLAVQLGRLVWIVAGPETAPAAVAAAGAPGRPADRSVFQRFDAFFRTGATVLLGPVAEPDLSSSGRLGSFVVIARLLPQVRDLRRAGSAAIDLCWAASGRVDAYFESGCNPWDLAAGTLIMREAGGVVTDLHGGEPSKAMCIAAPEAIHAGLQALIVG